MGLLTTATDWNKKVDSDLVITYSKNRVQGHWQITNPVSPYAVWYEEAWEYHRYARKSYRYVGLSLSAAETIAQNIIDSYKRSYVTSEWSGNGFIEVSSGYYAGAEVKIVQHIGHIYTVEVIVNEHDSKMRIEGWYTPSVLFTNENQRTYDY